ncbi:hypothetical protein [Spiroplasma poulsonii]|uniref:hypothetical protein n=1 Tax=Spiroplasma poulsonii TaxID=2138 RepID=UPI001F4C6090|nr:hypothetical protein [Spiroplasma poulsonii]UNF61619.1 hypothetical protein MNU24_06825 [Spiroplasma poulsonii]
MVKALINDYFNDKLLLLMLNWNSKPTPKKRQNNLILVKENTRSNTSNYQCPKIIATKFFTGKNMIMFYLKNQKSQF